MSLMDEVVQEVKPRPPRIMVYGRAGSGKSTFAACAPSPFFLSVDDGLTKIKANHLVADSLDRVDEILNMVLNDDHPYKTFVVDPIDWIERMLFDKLVKDAGAKSINEGRLGYGKGFGQALEYWKTFLDTIKKIWIQRHMAIIILAHDTVKRIEDPENESYDRYVPRMDANAYMLFVEWCDSVYFATRRIRVEKDSHKATPIGADGGERILRTVDIPAQIAKDRYGLPEEIPFSWPIVAQAIAGLNNKEQQE